MVWQALHPVAKIFIWFIMLFLIVGGTAYILYIINEALDRYDERQKQKASKPIDYTQIDFTYDSKGRVKRSRAELDECMKKWRKEA
jgi:TRAP-type C4-dicarboxylate transport system permease small subunit